MRRRGFWDNRTFWQRSGKVAIAKFAEESRPYLFSGAVFSEAVQGNEYADAVVNEQIKLTMEPLQIAAVSNDAMAIDIVFIKPEQHPVERWEEFPRRRVHLHSCSLL